LSKRIDTHEDYPKATKVSSLTGKGIREINDEIFTFIKLQKKLGFFEQKRQKQNIQWFKEKLDLTLIEFISKKNNFIELRNDLKKKVENTEISVPEAIFIFKKELKQNFC